MNEKQDNGVVLFQEDCKSRPSTNNLDKYRIITIKLIKKIYVTVASMGSA